MSFFVDKITSLFRQGNPVSSERSLKDAINKTNEKTDSVARDLLVQKVPPRSWFQVTPPLGSPTQERPYMANNPHQIPYPCRPLAPELGSSPGEKMRNPQKK